MNAVILTSILSCGNSTLYSASRLLYSMAESGKGAESAGEVSKGVPDYAVLFTAPTACLCFLTSLDSDSQSFIHGFITLPDLLDFLTWFGICICHIRFGEASKLQGRILTN